MEYCLTISYTYNYIRVWRKQNSAWKVKICLFSLPTESVNLSYVGNLSSFSWEYLLYKTYKLTFWHWGTDDDVSILFGDKINNCACAFVHFICVTPYDTILRIKDKQKINDTKLEKNMYCFNKLLHRKQHMFGHPTESAMSVRLSVGFIVCACVCMCVQNWHFQLKSLLEFKVVLFQHTHVEMKSFFKHFVKRIREDFNSLVYQVLRKGQHLLSNPLN